MTRAPALLLLLAGCATTPPPKTAATNYPPMVLGANVHPTDGHEPPRPCPPPGTSVTLKGGPIIAFQGANPASPDLCRMTLDGQPTQAWFGIWQTDWPGADQAHTLLARIMAAPSGTTAGFDNRYGDGTTYHDLVRNEGVEDIFLLGRAYHALKISHYREGADGNTYRSVSTVWKDIPSGLLIFGTYQHIAGRPEIDDPLIPARIVTSP